MIVAEGDATGVFVRRLAERAVADPAYLAWVVQSYAETEGRSTADVLAQMGVGKNTAHDFLVSLRPTGERFVEMLKTICVRFGANEPALLGVLREVEVLHAFRSGNPSGAAATDVGLLMAARMRGEESTPSGEGERVRRPDDEQSDQGGGGAR